MRTGYLLTGLALLLIANLLAMISFRPARVTREGFVAEFIDNAAPVKYSMGPFDNVRLTSGNNVSQYRYNHPNEPMEGPPFKLGPDRLFMFRDNQCKPECCGASYSCDGGCVCTTPEQREYINQRGGNRTVEDGF